jgi:hypothetical protein
MHHYVSEVACMALHSPAYEMGIWSGVTWRTMTCNREVGTYNRAPPEYAQYFWDYMADMDCRYLPGHGNKTWLRRARTARLAQILREEGVEEITSEILESRHSLLTQILQEDQRSILDSTFDVVLREFEDTRRRSQLFQRAVRRLCFQLRGAMTASGLVGLVPHGVEVGDFLVVIKGVCVPMILRKVGEEIDQYVVVGQAYFDGLMDGEALQSGEFSEQTITIV